MKRMGQLLLWIVMIGISFMVEAQENDYPREGSELKLFLCGDVMLGRGIDQALPKSVEPVLYERFVKDARAYVHLAERENGEFDLPVGYKYIWGDALKVWKAFAPDLKLVNLETSVTTSDIPWKGKGIHYRMHPQNIEALKVAGIDHVSLANNHILDWGRLGLEETLNTLEQTKIKYSGAGRSREEAENPSIFETDFGRVLIFSYGSSGSGIPADWAAEKDLSGVNFLPSLTRDNFETIKQTIHSKKELNDVIVFSIHWGGNWGYEIPSRHRKFAHWLIDEADVDLIFGHSSHHPLGVEVYKEKLIIYGAGDFINDYEGISGHEEYRSELSLMYLVNIKKNGELRSLRMAPMKIKRFQVQRAKEKDILWIKRVLNREGAELGTTVRNDRKDLILDW